MNSDPACMLAGNVLHQQIEGLEALKKSLDETFVQVINILAALQGRVIVTGMGKSGHIARKIAATLASTGTPAYFVHPGEAGHGDLGMITKDDAVLALSNSGDTEELTPILTYCKRFSIPVIAMVRRNKSMLADAADIALVLPDVPEASAIGAPTTSTTMMMALGDAIAMVLVEKRGFSKEDFSVLHPGGNIGQQLQRVAKLMHVGDELPLVEQADSMQRVLLTMTTKRFGCAGVTDKEGELIGIITDGDLRRHLAPEMLHQMAADVMTHKPTVINPSTLAAEALAIMNTKQITSLFITEGNAPVGIIHIHDCLRAGVA